MKKLRTLLFALLIAFFCAAGVSADVAGPGFLSASIGIVVIVLLAGAVLSAIGVGIWLIIRARRKK